MRVLGVDPGYNRLGLAIIKQHPNGSQKVEFSVCVETKKSIDFSKRLWCLAEEFNLVVDTYQPEVVAMEKIFLSQNKKTAMAVAETRGMLKFLIETKKLPLVEYTPQQIKLTVTGFGRADKTQVKNLVNRLTGVDTKQKLDDEVDALAVALTALAHHALVINRP